MKHRGKTLSSASPTRKQAKQGPSKLVSGFNPFEKYSSNWKSSPNRGEHKKYLKPPPGKDFCG